MKDFGFGDDRKKLAFTSKLRIRGGCHAPQGGAHDKNNVRGLSDPWMGQPGQVWAKSVILDFRLTLTSYGRSLLKRCTYEHVCLLCNLNKVSSNNFQNLFSKVNCSSIMLHFANKHSSQFISEMYNSTLLTFKNKQVV